MTNRNHKYRSLSEAKITPDDIREALIDDFADKVYQLDDRHIMGRVDVFIKIHGR